MADEKPARDRKRDFWQLDLPLVLVLILCTVLTIVEIRRAGDGNWRAWVYSFEWPLIAAFAIWIWARFRAEGNPAKAAARRWRANIERFEREAAVEEQAQHDPELRAWRDYVRDLEDEEPPPSN